MFRSICRHRVHGRDDVDRVLQLRHGAVRLLRTLRFRFLGDQQVFRHAVLRSAVRQRHTVSVSVSFHVHSVQSECIVVLSSVVSAEVREPLEETRYTHRITGIKSKVKTSVKFH